MTLFVPFTDDDVYFEHLIEVVFQVLDFSTVKLLFSFLCMFIHIHILSILMSMSPENHELMLMPPVLIQYHMVHCSFHHFRILTPFSDRLLLSLFYVLI